VKKLSVLVLTFSVWTLGAPALTQCQPRQSSQQDEKKPELVNIKGTVRADGNKITFVADEHLLSRRGKVFLASKEIL